MKNITITSLGGNRYQANGIDFDLDGLTIISDEIAQEMDKHDIRMDSELTVDEYIANDDNKEEARAVAEYAMVSDCNAEEWIDERTSNN